MPHPDPMLRPIACTCDGATSEGCAKHDHRPATNPDEYAVMWCHDCRSNVIAWRCDFDGPGEPWTCDQCGRDILCDACGQPYTEAHTCDTEQGA